MRTFSNTIKGFCLLFSYLSFFFLCIVLFSCRTIFVCLFFLSRTFFPLCRRTFFSGCRTFSLSAVPFIIFLVVVLFSSLSFFSPLSPFFLCRPFLISVVFSPLLRTFLLCVVFLHFYIFSFAYHAGVLPDRRAMFPSLASPKKFSIIVCLFFFCDLNVSRSFQDIYTG